MNGTLHVLPTPNPNAMQKLRAWQVPILLGLAIFVAPAISSAQVSLATVVDQGQRNSSSVKLADADLHKAYAVLSQTQDVYIPDFVIGSSIGPPSIGFPIAQPSIASATIQSLAYSVSQGQYIKAAQMGVRAASLALKDAKEQVALEASTEYIELDTVDRELEAAHRQAAFADRLTNIEQQRADAGLDPLSDLLQTRLTTAQLKLKVLHLEARASLLVAQLAALTGLPKASIQPDHASIPAIPAIHADDAAVPTPGIESAQAQAKSRQIQAHGDVAATKIWPLIAFGAQYNRDATSLNNYNLYFSRLNAQGVPEKLKADNFSAGFTINIPIFDKGKKAKARETAADALRATAEAEQAQRQNEVQIATLTGNLRELDAVAEIAGLKQQISTEQLKAVQTQLQNGNGAGAEPGSPPQLTPKAEQLARIDEAQRSIDAMDAGFDLSKARLSLLRALGHMDDWLREVAPAAPALATGAH